MSWLTMFPALRQILEMVSDPLAYEILICCSFALTIAWSVFWAVKIGMNGGGMYRLHPLPWIVIGLGFAALIGYIALFGDLNQRAAAGATGLWYMTRSPVLFGVVYCLIVPLFIGASIGLAIKAFIALFDTWR